VSLRLRSELHFRVGARHCSAQAWSAGLGGQPVAEATVDDWHADPLAEAWTRLRSSLDAGAVPHPRRAKIWIDDELLYMGQLPATLSRAQAQAAAHQFFTQALLNESLHTAVSLSADGASWFTFALPMSQLAAWQGMLDESSIKVFSATPAALLDLQRLGSHLQTQDELVVMAGAEGLRFADHCGSGVRHLFWERCDTRDAQEVARCVTRQLGDAIHTGQSSFGRDAPKPVLLIGLRAPQLATLRHLVTADQAATSWRIAPMPLLDSREAR